MTQHPEIGDATPLPSGKGGARWGQERRLEFIDYRLRWDGQLNRSDLTSFFGISVPQASLDLSEYIRRAPGNLEYDARAKLYRAATAFEPLCATTTLDRYLDDLVRVAVSDEIPYGSFLGWHPCAAVVPRPWRKLNADTVIAVLGAIRETRTVLVRYQSFTEAEPQIRELTPHALVSNGFRWHIRAYCHRRNEFRDFLFSRILEIQPGRDDKDRSQNDEAWHKQVRLVLTSHPDLDAGQRSVIESDYGMIDGTCELECRQALIFYALQQLDLLDEVSSKTPEAQQVILKNRAEISAWLPRKKQR
ncbi:WYL domain-containing protein [Burkholderia sp. Ax-1719]|uniref:helix-turn-helix transcriptional regulator n=1 Tax=Burkholderia sp. Ax-1719 TaxID=2608334 RepID=UPI001420CD17|nr:WYL domain-containing protein [Burkholderia sp. Ax-1719]NIE63155.1 WYL domain-containing protein [Burkholderia sp. Ax-1719]